MSLPLNFSRYNNQFIDVIEFDIGMTKYLFVGKICKYPKLILRKRPEIQFILE